MASTKQVKAAKSNVRKAQKAARSKRTIAKLPGRRGAISGVRRLRHASEAAA